MYLVPESANVSGYIVIVAFSKTNFGSISPYNEAAHITGNILNVMM
jgi:hypothetical protein